MDNNVLITGGSGFIGGFLVEEAIKRRYNVFVTIRKTTNLLKLRDKNIRFIEIDFNNYKDIKKKLSIAPSFKYIIHNAGITKAFKKKEYFEVNYENTKRFLNAIEETKRTPCKFIYMGSLAAYGPGDKRTTKPVYKTSIPKPVTEYGRSKLAAEKYIIEESKLPYLIFSPTAVYGPGEKDLFTTIKLINSGIDFKIGLKQQYFTFVYVKDLVKLVFDAMESSIVNKEYFVSDGNLYTKDEFSRIIKKTLGAKALSVKVPVWFAIIVAAISEAIAGFSGKQSILNVEKIAELSARNLNCDIEDLKKDFNYQPEYDLYKGMIETVKWYKKEGWLK